VEGAWVLLKSYRFFPRKSIFVGVVDPGVGSSRDAVIVRSSNYFFVGPDNGLVYPAAEEDVTQQIYSIEVDESISRTFHGRDVFAKAAARLSSGTMPESMGSQKSRFDVSMAFHLEGRTGQVVRIDRFGNIVTNIPPIENASVMLRTRDIERRLVVTSTYAQGPESELFVLTGSSGTLEVVFRNGRAADMLMLRVGDLLSLE
jgi:S-adenosylmethionine hydrolase